MYEGFLEDKDFIPDCNGFSIRAEALGTGWFEARLITMDILVFYSRVPHD